MKLKLDLVTQSLRAKIREEEIENNKDKKSGKNDFQNTPDHKEMQYTELRIQKSE